MQFAGIRGVRWVAFLVAAFVAASSLAATGKTNEATIIAVADSAQEQGPQDATMQPDAQGDAQPENADLPLVNDNPKPDATVKEKEKPAHDLVKPGSSAEDDAISNVAARAKKHSGVTSSSLNAKLSARKSEPDRSHALLNAETAETAKPLAASNSGKKPFDSQRLANGKPVDFEAVVKDAEPPKPEARTGKDASGAGKGRYEAQEETIKPIPVSEEAEAEADESESESEEADPEDQPITVEAASFSGVIPGSSTKADVEKVWGKPIESAGHGDSLSQLYSVGPFKHVEVGYAEGKVSSVVIRFEQTYPTATVAKQLDLTRIRSVVVSNDIGEVLGVSYPERGVLFAFEPDNRGDVDSAQVTQIILESISAEPFVLRAETVLEQDPDACRRDLEQALTLEYGNARTHWLYSRVLLIAEDYAKALEAAAEAVRIEPDNPRYRVTYSQILGQLGRFSDAVREAEKAASLAESLPHVKARALCLQGDLLASGAKPDYQKAISLHTEAIQTADPLVNDEHPAIRIAAKEALIDGHLGAAHDIAWGDWKDKNKAVPRWLERASAVADDLVENEGVGEEQRFHAHARALAVIAGIRGGLDPLASTKAVLKSGETLIAATESPSRKAQHEWDLGLALYDAVQIFQMRSAPDEALKYGEAAVQHLERGNAKTSPANTLLLGRLYFRIGAIYVTMRDHDHKTAVDWFDKAVPLLDRPLPEEAMADVGRHGETLVSMGVSYWEVGQREKAVGLTQKGIAMMEHGVRQGSLDRSSLAVPYHNLAAMHRQLGAGDLADHFQEMATRLKSEKTR